MTILIFSLPARVIPTSVLLCALMSGSLHSAPPRTEQPRRAAPSRSAEAKLELNTASPRALAAVPVIGSDGAQAIVAARPFTTIDDLNRLTGISAERLEQIRARVVVSPETIPERAKKGAPPPDNGKDHRRARVNVNTASYETLAALPPVGPEIAKALIAARPLANLGELDRLGGISAERLEQIRLNLTIGEPTQSAKDTPPPAPRAR